MPPLICFITWKYPSSFKSSTPFIIISKNLWRWKIGWYYEGASIPAFRSSSNISMEVYISEWGRWIRLALIGVLLYWRGFASWKSQFVFFFSVDLQKVENLKPFIVFNADSEYDWIKWVEYRAAGYYWNRRRSGLERIIHWSRKFYLFTFRLTMFILFVW